MDIVFYPLLAFSTGAAVWMLVYSIGTGIARRAGIVALLACAGELLWFNTEWLPARAALQLAGPAGMTLAVYLFIHDHRQSRLNGAFRPFRFPLKRARRDDLARS